MSGGREPRVLMVPMHPGMQYHFARVGLPTYVLGHWDQFQYWRPRPPNVIDLLPAYEPAQLAYGPEDYRRLLDERASPAFPEAFDLAWLHFPWQAKLFWDDRTQRKVYFVAKEDEISEAAWGALLDRPDFDLASYYPRTTQWAKDRFGVDLPQIQLGVDPGDYGPWTGERRLILTVIHSWRDRGWRYAAYLEAVDGLPAIHVDHLDRSKPHVGYEDLRELMRTSRLYLHDGEREYTIALIEAMMTGLPIVSFELPGIEGYVEHGVNGFVGRSAAEIRESCRLLLDDGPLAARMGAASRAKALANHHEARWRADWRALIGPCG